MVIRIAINEQVFLKDPDSTKLGQKIVTNGIALIDEIGFESFTFKKLAKRIGSTEASIYRYFENKHKLLIYLVSWYWNWLEYQLIFLSQNIDDSWAKFYIAIKVISQPHLLTDDQIHIDKTALHRIVIRESPKAYLSKEVDLDNKEGYFLSYKRLCGRIADIARTICPDYPYPRALVSTLIESAHNQMFFAAHLPRLTDLEPENYDALTNFLSDMAERMLGSGHEK